MPTEPADPLVLPRDGTSQNDRHRASLDPSYAKVDDRTLEDLLTFVKAYANELVFINEANLPDGTWSGLFAPAEGTLGVADLAAFLNDPSRPPVSERALRRPHLVLLLTFLKLFEHAQDHLNGLTKRHLEFYYEQLLEMTRKPALPDQVAVLFTPAIGVDSAEVPAGTLLNAGQDAEGQLRRYATNRLLVVNRATVERLSSVWVERRRTTITSARETNEGTTEDGFLAMLGVALGDPLPGDPLPPYTGGRTVDLAFVSEVGIFVDFIAASLHMEPYELRALIGLKRERDAAVLPGGDWETINGIVEAAGQNKNAGYTASYADPRAFEANLADAVFAGSIPAMEAAYAPLAFLEITDVNGLYDNRGTPDVDSFITGTLFFPTLADFDAMMVLKLSIDAAWRAINRTLETAGQRLRQDASYKLLPATTYAFDTNLDAAVGTGLTPTSVVWPTTTPSGALIASLDDYYAELEIAEAYFHLTAEGVQFIGNTGTQLLAEQELTADAWSAVDATLLAAHQEKVYAKRRGELEALWTGGGGGLAGFDAMVREALGGANGTDDQALLAALAPHVALAADLTFLQGVRATLQAAQPVSANDQARAVNIVERAERVRLAQPSPVPEIVEWRNLYANEDATSVSIPGPDGSAPRWKTFGQRRPTLTSAPPEQLGWGIASPLLYLESGTRVLTLTLGFEADGFDLSKIGAALTQGALKAEISTEQGWQELTVTTSVVAGTAAASDSYQDLVRPGQPLGDTPLDQHLPAIQIVATMGVELDPTAPPTTFDPTSTATWPVLRLMLRQIQDTALTETQFITLAAPFETLHLVAAHILATVNGLTISVARNDDGVVDTTSPIELFGLEPPGGARFSIAHRELANRSLQSLVFHTVWEDPPADLATDYAMYATPAAMGKVQIDVVDRFRSTTISGANSLDLLVASLTTDLTAWPGDIPSRRPALDEPADPLEWDRYFQWELQAPGFGHAEYSELQQSKSLQLAIDIANGQTGATDGYEVKVPYRPVLQSLLVDHSASTEVVVNQLVWVGGIAPVDTLHHFHPFGAHAVEPESGSTTLSFLPDYPHEGELYLGIHNLEPPQNLTLLFQVAEGSANPDLEAAEVRWSALDGNRWVSLNEGQVLSDSTRGLINSGVVELSLRPVQPSTRMPPGPYWIRAHITQHPEATCDTIAVHTQAVSATFVDNNNAAAHYAEPLPATSITRFVTRVAGIARVEQPYTSYGAQAAEQDEGFYTRVAERLRHKTRAVALWDYERVVLDAFPELYKVKCLPAASSEFGEGGLVQVLIIPNIRNQIPQDPFEPKASTELLARVQEYLVTRISPWARVEVINPHYIRVKVRLGVQFKSGYDTGFYTQELIHGLNRHLSPWAYDEGADIALGEQIYANSIVDFADRQPYVEYVNSISLFTSDDGVDFTIVTRPSIASGEPYAVSTQRPDAVLVAARDHQVDLISPDADGQSFTGINYMIVELDFIVG